MSEYSIKVYRELDDAQLKTGWKKLQRRKDVFAQMYFEWVAAWWEQNKVDKRLYVISVFDEEREVVGIAPFFIKRVIGIRVLRSMPVHFGDFHHFLSRDGQAIRKILRHVYTFEEWSAVHIFNVNSQSLSYSYLKKFAFSERKIVDILSPEFVSTSFEEYVSTLSKNTRQSFRKRLRRLEKQGCVKLVKIVDRGGYLENFHHTKRLYDLRWAQGNRPLLGDNYYRMRNAAITPLFDYGIAVLYLLKLDDQVIAYRLGFLNDNAFYDWKTCHDPEYDYFSPGFLSIGLIIESLISDGYVRLNFMAGDYQYKRSWSNRNEDNYNSEFLAYKKCSAGYFFVRYILSIREHLKDLVRKFGRIG